jgi:hypothetical protein
MEDLNKEQIYLQWLFEKNQLIQQMKNENTQLRSTVSELEAQLTEALKVKGGKECK